MRALHYGIASLLMIALSACSALPTDLTRVAPPAATIAAPPATAEPEASEEAEPMVAATAVPVPLPTVAPVATLAPDLTNALEQEQAVLVELFRRINPAVVSIEVLGNHPATDGGSTPDEIPFGQGSGFLYDDQGHIVTNNHVVEGASSFQVRFADGSAIKAELIGTDPGSDLAVLKVGQLPDGAAPLSLADSEEVAVGQTAIAIGNPFGLQNTLTVGVVSGVGRSLAGPESRSGGRFRIPNVIQTDAAINPGNSGGPLLNVRGQVIGVNTAIRSESGTFEGVGYAVPSNAVRRVIPSIISTGRYEHPWMGIGMFDIDPLLAEQFQLRSQQGVLVTEVQPGSPAERAGLQAGTQAVEAAGRTLPADADIIIAINGVRVLDSDDLVSYLELNTSVGDTVEMTVVRGGEERVLEMTLGSRPGE
jgi:2-alkenal reductase